GLEAGGLISRIALGAASGMTADGSQLFKWIIRSTDRRALPAIIGSIVTSSFMETRLSRIFGSVMRFMCGQRLHGLTNSTPGSSAFTLSAIEHSVTITTRFGLFLRTQSIMPLVEPV